jgi:selenocysteine-specific elongation factor
VSLQVVATAGHVDHGKSTLVERLTGIDPDRWEEEKRRGLTIDLGFAWATLPSGREIGFVDVPGHERFIRNMLAGVGPLRVVLFVVAADEGWKPQSEEHLAIVDVLGASGGVVALTKSDLVNEEQLAARTGEIRVRLEGTTLADAPILACSARTGDGIEELVAALDRAVGSAPIEDDQGRARIHIDRAFTVTGAGTVVTGSLTGGELAVGDEVVILPSGVRARVRSLQTHRRTLDVARPVSRVAANIAGVPREGAQRGDVLVRSGQWRPTTSLDVWLRPVRSVTHPLTGRGAYKLYVGSAERDARLRLHGAASLDPGSEGFARLRLTAPVVAAYGDRFVLREAGRRATVGGGVILDPHPDAARGDRVLERLQRRRGASAADLPGLLVEERGAVRSAELLPLAGVNPGAIAGAELLDGWWVSASLASELERAVASELEAFHRENPLLPGLESAELRSRVPTDTVSDDLLTAVMAGLERRGVIERKGTLVRRPGHAVSLGDREDEAARLVADVAAAEPTPPTQPQLEARGFPRALIDACVATGRLARVSRELVVTPAFLAGAEQVAREQASREAGMTVSTFREALGTTRKYALPILGSFDERGLTRRDGDVRRLRD